MKILQVCEQGRDNRYSDTLKFHSNSIFVILLSVWRELKKKKNTVKSKDKTKLINIWNNEHVMFIFS